MQWVGPPRSEVCILHQEHTLHFWKKLTRLKENRLQANENTSEKVITYALIYLMDN